MAQDSKIEWTHHTVNLWWGCTKVHAGCDNCYAETLSHRWDFDLWGNDKPRRRIESVWKDLDRFQRDAAKSGEIHRVFVGSMMDIFEKPIPLVDKDGSAIDGEDTSNLRFQLFYRIDRGDYPNLFFLLLTKRPSNIDKYIFNSWKILPPANVMYGYSPVNDETAKNIKHLLEVPGKHFLSVEPQLDSVDLTPYLNGVKDHRLDWVIQGGESGHHKRPFNLDWAYSMREQCEAAGVPYFFKQIDKVQPVPEDLMNRQFPD